MASWRIKHPGALVSEYAFNGNALDGTGRYPGVLTNAPTWADGPTGRQCIEFDGDDAYVNIRDVTQLNSASAFSICFWMNQDVLDATDRLFRKSVDANNSIIVWTDTGTGRLYVYVRNAGATEGYFDYSTVISAASWHHVAVVFDGAQAANASRLVVHVDGAPIALTFNGTIPATTADMSGQDATIGYLANTFDGRLYDFRIFSVPLSRDEVRSIIHWPVPNLP